MVVPHLLTRVEERYDLSRFRVNAGEISALVRVASVAGQRKVCRVVIAAMLARNDMLDLEARKRQVFLLEPTILAAIAGAATNQFALRPSAMRRTREDSARLGLQNSDQVNRIDVGSVFTFFSLREIAFVAFHGELVDACLRDLIRP